MNGFRNYFGIACICMLLLLLPICAFASESGLKTEPFSPQEQERVWKNKELQLIDEPVVISGFADFDVNQKGQYALAYDGIVKDRVLVYDAEGNWLWGFTFYNDGALYVRWNEDNILVYFVRSDVIVEVDKTGDCIGMWYVLDTPERYRYVDEIFDAKECTVNGDTYRAEHWLFTHELIRWGKYPRLVKITPDGEKTVLFDRTIGQIVNSFVMFATMMSFGFVTIIALSRTIKKNLAKRTGEQCFETPYKNYIKNKQNK